MTLFSRLLRLHGGMVPLEDFFTEIVTYLFSTSHKLLCDWIAYANLVDIHNYNRSRISSQPTFAALDRHAIDSRPDILIELLDNDSRDVIIIESKVGSSEGQAQLRRYAEILAELPNTRQKLLLYITRNFEPKDEKVILRTLPERNVRFKQLRWYMFYNFLRLQPPNIFVMEVIKFMEEKGMAQSNQFTITDILTLSNMSKVLSIMDETMWGEVKAKFQEIVSPKVCSPRKSVDFLRDWGRYIMYADMSKELWCGLGYTMHAEYPTVMLYIKVNRSLELSRRQEIVDILKEVSKRPGWRGVKLSATEPDCNIIHERSFRDLLSEEDHVSVIKAYFLEVLEELSTIKKNYLSLMEGTNSEETIEDQSPRNEEIEVRTKDER